MKKITQFFVLAIAFIAYGTVANAQSTINFETVGQDWNWTIFENGTNDASLYSVVANPASSTVNSSSNCAKYIVNSTAQPWAGIWSDDLTDFTFSSSNCIVKVKVYKSVISKFDVKFEGAGGLNFEVQVANTKINDWEELTFDFTSHIGSTVTRLVIIPDFPATRTAGSTNYFDDISFNAGIAPPSLPASPVPSPSQSDVLSIYSDAYTVAATGIVYNSWWNATWSNTTLDGGGNAKKMVSTSGGGGGGIEFAALDISGMGYIHMDVYPTTATAVANVLRYNVVPVGGGGAGWTAFPALIANQWNTVNIPVSALALPGTSVFQVGFGTFGGDGTFYIDNVFFSKSFFTSVSNPTTSDIRIFPNPMIDQLNINAASEIKAIEIRNLIGQLVKSLNVNNLENLIDMSSIATGNYMVTVKLANGQVLTDKVVKL